MSVFSRKIGGAPLSCASILGGNFLNKLVSLGMLAALTGYLSPAEFGRYSFVVAYAAFFGVFTELGLNTLVTREIAGARVEREAAFGRAIILRVALTCVTAAACMAVLVALGYPAAVLELAAAAMLSMVFSFRGLYLRTVFDIPFQAELKMGYPAAINLMSDLLALLTLVWLILAKASLFYLVLGLNLANVPGFILAAWLSTNLIRPRFELDPRQLWRLLRQSLPLGASAMLEALFVMTPVLLLSTLAAEADIGLYSLPFRLAASLWIVPVAVMVTLLPGMSLQGRSGPHNGLLDGFGRGLRAVMLAGVPLAILTDAFAEDGVALFAGPGYAGSGKALAVMAWGTLFYFVNTVFLYSYAAAGRQALAAAFWGVNAACLAALCLLLIPGMGYLGAAYAFTISLGAGLAFNLLAARSALGAGFSALIARYALPAALAVLTLSVLSGEGRQISSAAGLSTFVAASFAAARPKQAETDG